MEENRFHACATCVNFHISKTGSSIQYTCGRLGYETKTHYQFNCWSPKENVKKLMAKDSHANGE
jgi:hypothetical protein